jgi:hypothetical protein
MLMATSWGQGADSRQHTGGKASGSQLLKVGDRSWGSWVTLNPKPLRLLIAFVFVDDQATAACTCCAGLEPVRG